MQAERVPRVAFLLAGVAAGALSRVLASRHGREVAALRREVTALEAQLARQDAAQEQRFTQIEARLDEHETRLAAVPNTEQIVGAMEELLDRTMHTLDQRLTVQSESIELLKTTVTQTDTLLERVLESLDSLRRESAPAE